MKKETEIHASFAITPQTAKVIATVHEKGLVKMGKALHLWEEDMNRKHVLIDVVPGSNEPTRTLSQGSPWN